MINKNVAADSILGDDDPHPVDFLPGTADDYPILLVCDHAGNLIPQRLQADAPTPEVMESHVAVDIGARRLAEEIASLLELPLVKQRYSRLVIDCNRPLDTDGLVLATSDGISIPFNHDIDAAEIEHRWNAIHQPYHRFIARLLAGRTDSTVGRGLVAVHSFTPQLHDQPPRPWHLDVVRRNSSPFIENFMASLKQHLPRCNIGFQEVFKVADDVDYTLPYHGEAGGIPLHVSLEVRNDLLRSTAAIKEMAAVISRSLIEALTVEIGNNTYIARMRDRLR